MRTITLRGLFTVLAVLALSASTAHAQTLVKGKVVDEQNKPVEGAVIHFEQQDANTKRDAKSDKKGEFIFMGLPSGEYRVTATKGTLTDSQPAHVTGSQSSFVSLMVRENATAPGAGTVQTDKAVTSITSGAEQSEAEQLKALATSALEAYNAKNNEEAAAKFKELVKKVPTCPDCYLYLGISLFGAGEPEEAEAALKKSVELKPNVEAYAMLMRFYNQQKNLPAAEEMSKKIAALTSQDEAARAANGARRAETASANAEVESQNSSAGAYNEGVTLWNATKYADAKAKFEQAAKVDPKNADAQYMIGMANLNLGQIPAARSAFQEYLKISPNGDKSAQVKTFLTQLPK